LQHGDPQNSVTLYPGFAVTEGDTVLDLGCGAGETCERVGRVGAAVIAIDVDQENLKRAEARMKHIPARSFRAIRSDCDPIPLDDGSVTAVIAQEVLEHVSDPRHLVSEMTRVGAPEARYLVSVPDPLSENLIALVADASYFQPPNHTQVFDRLEIESILADAGLEIVSRSFVGFFWSLWWLFSIASSPHHLSNWPSCRGKPTGREARTGLVQLWEKTWWEFGRKNRFEVVQSILDKYIPKSQVYVAKKRGQTCCITTPHPVSGNLELANERLRQENEALRMDLQRVMASRSWRYTEPLRNSKEVVVRALNYVCRHWTE
jgi:SAM-dependent methyltransferase